MTKSWNNKNAPSSGINSQLVSEKPVWATPPEWGMQNCLNYPCPIYLGGPQEKPAQSTYLISLWCSSRQMPSSRHSAPQASCWNILPDQKTSQQFSSSCATWYWTLRVHFLKSLSILFSSSWPHFSTGWWPALPMRRERTALLLRNMLRARWTSSKSKLTWSPGRPPRRPTWPPQSPRRSGGGARWRERLLWSGGSRWEKSILIEFKNPFNPSNLFIVVRPKDCWHHQVLTNVVPCIAVTKVCRRFSRLQYTAGGDSR